MMNEITVDQLLSLETAVWEALVKGDAAADGRALADHFLGVYDTGFADKNEHMGMLDNGPTMASYLLSEARIQIYTAEIVLLSYRADYVPVHNGREGSPSAMYISSIWHYSDETWLNTFSQDTPIKR